MTREIVAQQTNEHERVMEIRRWLDEFLWPEPDGKQRAKRARILTSATSLFVRYGYRKTSIDEVANCLLYTSPSPRDA